MSAIVSVVGLAVFGFGVFGMFRPAGLLRLVATAWETRSTLYVAVVVRLALGISLIGVAPDSRFPDALRILGALSVISATVAFGVGYERALAFVGWATRQSSELVRVWAGAASVFGIFLVVAVW